MQESTKQMSLHTLPATLVFHLKRFEHSGGGAAAGGKLDSFCQFSLELDVTNYLATSLASGETEEYVSLTAFYWFFIGFLMNKRSLANPEIRSCNSYTLYAVIVHMGGIESGHYISYVLWHGEVCLFAVSGTHDTNHYDKWFKIDDDVVSRASVSDVLNSKAYASLKSCRLANDRQ